MTLASMLGLGTRNLVSFVGAGGKSTLLLALGHELAAAGRKVVVTTTTKMGAQQIPGWAGPAHDSSEVAASLAAGRSPFLIASIDASKIVGVTPAVVDQVFATADVHTVLVEADGARGNLVKAPDAHEPVIPSRTTRVVVVASVQAVGARIADVAHRPERVAAILGTGVDHVVEPEDMAAIVGNPEGGLARIPGPALVTVALTSATPGRPAEAAERIRGHLATFERIERVVLIPDLREPVR